MDISVEAPKKNVSRGNMMNMLFVELITYMSKILISTDSTADLSQQLLQQNKIEVFSLTIVRDGESLKDGVDIKTPDIFEFKEKTGRLTTTSAGNIADYEEFFLHHLKEYDEIIHFTISSDMSSSYANAKLGAEEMDNVYVIDSRNLSTGIGLQVLKACDLRDSGKSAKEIVEYRTNTKIDSVVAINSQALDAILSAAGPLEINGKTTNASGIDIIREDGSGGVSRGDAVMGIVKAAAKAASSNPNVKSSMVNAALDQYSKGNIVMTPQGSFVGLLATKGIENILH